MSVGYCRIKIGLMIGLNIFISQLHCHDRLVIIPDIMRIALLYAIVFLFTLSACINSLILADTSNTFEISSSCHSHSSTQPTCLHSLTFLHSLAALTPHLFVTYIFHIRNYRSRLSICIILISGINFTVCF